MRKVLRIYHVDAFTEAIFHGSPVCVVMNGDGLTTRQMKMLAGELHSFETAFVLDAQDSSHDLRVSVITPAPSVPFFGSGIIAANIVRAEESRSAISRSRQLVGTEVIDVEVRRSTGNACHVWLQQPFPSFGPALSDCERAKLHSALGVKVGERGASPIDMVYGDQAVVMIPLREIGVLKSIRPDFPALLELSNTIGCDGFLAFVPSEHAQSFAAVHVRMFAPAIGRLEAPVSGSACAFLAAYLYRNRLLLAETRSASGRRLLFTQCDPMGRNCQVHVELRIDADGKSPTLRFGGGAVVSMFAELEIEVGIAAEALGSR
jgi:PhzF family phenazine biosynthesis protein